MSKIVIFYCLHIRGKISKSVKNHEFLIKNCQKFEKIVKNDKNCHFFDIFDIFDRTSKFGGLEIWSVKFCQNWRKLSFHISSAYSHFRNFWKFFFEYKTKKIFFFKKKFIFHFAKNFDFSWKILHHIHDISKNPIFWKFL